uniref:V-SNARE coiled-coil homology domain-containing protein n=1 Tax=Angiostrongylus cantonensis TaxID=6313 RepID=A0A0K0DL69_ANGCA
MDDLMLLVSSNVQNAKSMRVACAERQKNVNTMAEMNAETNKERDAEVEAETFLSTTRSSKDAKKDYFWL